MANYRVGDIIRLTRLASGLTQEQLCENICSIETISRIENGKHKVKRETYHRLMEKMNRFPEKNYAICVDKDMQIMEERARFEGAMAKHDFETADCYMKLLKEKAGSSAPTIRYIRRESAFLDFYQKRITAEKLVELLKELAEEVVPGYEKFLDSDVVFPFMEQEIILLKRLAIAYGRTGENELAIKISKMLLRSLRTGYMAEWREHEISIIGDMSFFYQRIGDFKTAAEITKNVLLMAKKYDEGTMMEEALFNSAWDILREIRRGERQKSELADCKKLMRKAYYFALARNDKTNLKIFSDYYREQFGEEIEIKL